MANTYRYNLAEIKAQARGRWLSILPALGGDLLRTASKRNGKTYQHTPCPVCGGTDRFGLLPDVVDTGAAHCRNCGGFPDGFDLLRKINGWSLPWALQQVAEYIGGGACAEPVARVGGGAAESLSPEKQASRRKAIASILAKCQHEPGEIHRAYFQNRGIPAAADLRSGSLLYHPGLPYYVNGKPLLDGKGGWKTWPAIVGRVSSSSGWLGLQRVYLTRDGRKADDEIMLTAKENGLIGDFRSKPMLSISGMTGGAVRFGKAGKVLAVGEGIETMLAVSIGLGGFMSVAAAGTAALLEGLEIPEQVERLLIFSDKDANGRGEQAANALESRVSSQIDVSIILPGSELKPSEKSLDWLDEVVYNASSLELMKNKVII
jgi:putative DNA primase/helicase